MEEEIIIPDEEVFNYHSLRYILDKNGYVCHASLGGLVVCDLGECTEYEGEVPNGYSTIEEWFDGESDKLNAWKIVEDNLVFDENRYNDLQKQYEIETEKNASATHEWVRNQLGKSSQVVIDEFTNNIIGTSLVVLNDSGEYEIPELKVSSETIEECEVLVSNKNLLGIEALTQTLNGVTFTINEDGTITLNGTATSNIEMNLKGTSNNLDMLFLIQKETNYVVSGLASGINLNLYSYDGTDRSLIGTYSNEVITLDDSSKITQVTLNVASGTKFEDVTISPQIEINEAATEFVKHQENKTIITLYKNEGSSSDLYSYNPITVIMANEDVDIDVSYFKYKSLNEKFAEIQVDSEGIKQSVSNVESSINGEDGLASQLNIVKESIETVKTTILQQTEETFEMLFKQTGIEDTINHIEEGLNGSTDQLNTITEYIRFEGASIELGKSTSQTKLVIRNDRISFMTGDSESAYISENTLYITDSTILNKMQVGRWVTQEDAYGNLNTKWVGGVS